MLRTFPALCALQNSVSFTVKFSTGLSHQKNFTNVKVGRIIDKLLNKSTGKRKNFYAHPFIGRSEALDFIPNYNSSYKNDRRVEVLNKVFMKNITDFMATGEICPEIFNRGIQISKVKVTPTFHQVNVYWHANGTDEDSETEKLLAEFAPQLRHELSQLRVMGLVPKIEFIKDSSYLKYMAVESILKTADFGDDFKPSPIGNDWKIPPSDESKSQESFTEFAEEPLPIMSMDTFGLKHEVIMKRVNLAVNRVKALQRRDSSINFPISDINDSAALNSKERKKLFKEFLSKKKLEWKKAAADHKKYRPEIVIHEELENKFMKESFEYSEEDENNQEFDQSFSYIDNDYSRDH